MHIDCQTCLNFRQFVLTLTATYTLVLPETSLFSGQWVTQLTGCALKRPLVPLKSEQDGYSIDEICKHCSDTLVNLFLPLVLKQIQYINYFI